MEIDPTRIVVQFTSNKAELTTDLSNRSSCVRILKHPDNYRFRSYAAGDLLQHVEANQPRYLGAVFAVIREWHRCGKPLLDHADHDFRQWARTLGYIVKEILQAGDLMAGHRAAQERMASPALNWLRDVVLAVDRSELAGLWLRPSKILQILVDAGIKTPGIEDAVDGEGSEAWENANRTLGRKLASVLRNDKFAGENFTVVREQKADAEGRLRYLYCFSSENPACPA